jgi:hypothetical protein
MTIARKMEIQLPDEVMDQLWPLYRYMQTRPGREDVGSILMEPTQAGKCRVVLIPADEAAPLTDVCERIWKKAKTLKAGRVMKRKAK